MVGNLEFARTLGFRGGSAVGEAERWNISSRHNRNIHVGLYSWLQMRSNAVIPSPTRSMMEALRRVSPVFEFAYECGLTVNPPPAFSVRRRIQTAHTDHYLPTVAVVIPIVILRTGKFHGRMVSLLPSPASFPARFPLSPISANPATRQAISSWTRLLSCIHWRR
jgi:hypothetical protein